MVECSVVLVCSVARCWSVSGQVWLRVVHGGHTFGSVVVRIIVIIHEVILIIFTVILIGLHRRGEACC